MIIFTGLGRRLTETRKTPDQYDIMYFNRKSVMFWTYDQFFTNYGNYKVTNVQKEFPCGWAYHVLRFQKLLLTNKMEIDNFNACLLNPLDYAESIVDLYWQGFIGKIAENSQSLFAALHDVILTTKGKIDGSFRQ